MFLSRSVLARALALGVFLGAVTVNAQGNSADHRSPVSYERGDVATGLPRNGPLASGAVVTGNGINYNGGPVMHPVNLYFIFYGNWSADSTGPSILETWGRNIAPSPYFAISTTYGDSTGASVPNLVTYEGSYIDTGTLGTSLNDASIGILTSNAINHGFSNSPNTPGAADPNGLYMVLTAPGVAETSGFLSSYCGWHWSGSFINGGIVEGTIYSGTPVVKFAFIGNAAGPSFGSCAAQSTSPNGDPGADAMISVMAHELSEGVSDPEGNAWYVSNGEEDADLCAWNFGATQAASNGSMFNVTLNGVNYLMQQIWLNADGGSCALSYTPTVDFSVSVSGSQTVPPGGTSSAYKLTDTPLNGFTGAVTWTISPPAGITASAPVPATGSPSTFTLTASSAGAGTYTIPIVGTSGLLSHSTTASLTVTAPTFTLSISPSSQTVNRPTSGAATATYTVNVIPVGGFTSPVTLTVTGGTTGVTPSIVASTSPITPGGNGTLVVSVTDNAKKGSRTLTVTGSASGKTAKASATISIH